MSERLRRRRPDVLWRRSLDAVLVLPSAADDVVTLAGTGVDVWALLETWTTVEQLTEALAAAFAADPAVVRADIATLLDSLDDLGVLESAADSDEAPRG
jgi:hypothetical protein